MPTRTRVERINEKGTQDYFMPVDVSELNSEDTQEIFGEHPLEQFEQIFMDLIIKGAQADKKKQKAMRNYLRQVQAICKNCYCTSIAAWYTDRHGVRTRNSDHRACFKGIFVNPHCRVYQFRMRWGSLLWKFMKPPLKPDGKIYVKLSTMKGLWRNRWNWKMRSLKLIDRQPLWRRFLGVFKVGKVRG